MAGGGGWSDLPLDLFSLVFSKLYLPQFLRSAAVCVSWSAAVRDLSTRDGCFKFRGQSPWFVLNDNPRGDPSAVTFYALDEAREYTIPVPDPPISDRIFLGSAHGWIITVDVRLRVQLLNPIAGAQIDLPLLSRVFPSEHTHPIRDTAGRLIGFMMPKPLKEGQVHSYIDSRSCLEQIQLKAILSADPSLGDGYTVALIQYPSGRIFVTRSGDEKWFDLSVPLLIENMVFRKGKLYMRSRTFSGVYVCDLDEAQIQHGEMPRFRMVDRCGRLSHLLYLFETPRGDLLSIWRERNRDSDKTISFKVKRVIDEEKPGKRLGKTMDVREFIDYIISYGGMDVVDEEILLTEEVEDLGDLVVFLDGRNPLCLSASDFPHLTPNSIYFTDYYMTPDPEFLAFCRMFKEGNSERFRVHYLHRNVPLGYATLMFLERNWFRKILNGPISFSMDDTNFVRLYWQPPSTSINYLM